MNEIVNFEQITRLRANSNNKCTIYWTSIEDRLLNVYVNNEEYKGLTPEEIIKKFGTNYTLMQELRYLMQQKKDENMEEIYQNAQSVKNQIIDIFVSLMKEDNIFRDHLSIEEIKARLERNIDAVYIVDDAYEEGVGGWYNLNSRNIYVKAENPNELKEFLKSGNAEKILRGEFEKICHECIHALSPQGLEVPDNISWKKGIAINEGVVQFFTRKISAKRYSERHWWDTDTYAEQVSDTEGLISVYGKNIIDAYFRGDAQSIYNNPTTMAYVTSSDIKLALKDVPDQKELLNTVNEMHKGFKKNLIHEQGIDLFNLFKYEIPWPYEITNIGIKLYSIIKFMRDDSEQFKELLGCIIYRWHLGDQENKIIWDAIQEEMESQDEASIETLLKYGLIYFVEDGWGHKNLSNSTSIGHISAILLNKYDNNWELLLQETPNIFNSLSNTLGEDESQNIMETILYRAWRDTHQVPYSPDSGFKSEIIKELTNFKRWKQLEQIIQNMSSINDLEYYRTTMGKCIIVNSNNGNIIQVMSEDDGYGWYKEDMNNEEDEFCMEKDENGKYILKSYTTSVDGERMQLDVGLGRNFLDDTTQIDREIITQTASLKISEIQSAMTDIEAIAKGNKEERDREDE